MCSSQIKINNLILLNNPCGVVFLFYKPLDYLAFKTQYPPDILVDIYFQKNHLFKRLAKTSHKPHY